MSDPTERLDQPRGRLSALTGQLATNRLLQVLIAVVVLALVAVPFYLFAGDEGPLSEGGPEREPAEAVEAKDEEERRDPPADAQEPPATDAVPADTTSPDSSPQPQDPESSDEPSSPRGCPQPGVPGRDFPATEWQATGDMYVHVHPEQWYVSAWCATEAVAQSLDADGWRMRSWSDSRAAAVLVKSGLDDDSVFAVEYEVQAVRTERGWYLDPEQAAARYWCSRGVDETDPSRCV